MKLKSVIALRLARRIEARTRRLRRSLRDQQRDVLQRIHTAESRARGLRLYAAWSAPKKTADDDQPMRLLPSAPLQAAA